MADLLLLIVLGVGVACVVASAAVFAFRSPTSTIEPISASGADL